MQKTRRWILPVAAAMLAACAQQPTAVAPPARPVKPARPAPTDAQLKERARLALQKATESSNEYSACVMFSTSTSRKSDALPADIVTSATANCAPKLDDYEQSMTTYYGVNPVKNVSTASPRERAHADRLDLEQHTRDAVSSSITKTQ
jgi:hypothetical protein